MKKIISLFLTVLLLCAGCVYAEPEEPDATPAPPPTPQELIAQAISLYGSCGPEKSGEAAALLDEAAKTDPDRAARWRKILAAWNRFETSDIGECLPEGLPDTDALCLVVFGYQLDPGGNMRPELYERLRVAVECFKRYQNAYILCTGGHTAPDAEEASEADRMAGWLIRSGVPPTQVIVEDESLTTTQNAEFVYNLLTNEYPSVTTLAVISSDYHVVSCAILLDALSILRAPAPGEEAFRVLACAACPKQPGVRSSFAVSGLKSFLRED